MNSILNWATEQVARELGISPTLAHLIYKSYWKFVRDSIKDIDIDNMAKEDFSSITTNFTIPYIGKLYTSFDKVEKYRKKVKYLEENVKAKKN